MKMTGVRCICICVDCCVEEPLLWKQICRSKGRAAGRQSPGRSSLQSYEMLLETRLAGWQSSYTYNFFVTRHRAFEKALNKPSTSRIFILRSSRRGISKSRPNGIQTGRRVKEILGILGRGKQLDDSRKHTALLVIYKNGNAVEKKTSFKSSSKHTIGQHQSH